MVRIRWDFPRDSIGVCIIYTNANWFEGTEDHCILIFFQNILQQTYGNDCRVFAIMVVLHLLIIFSHPLVLKRRWNRRLMWWYSVLPSFRPKKVNLVIFGGISTLRPPKQSVGKMNFSAINWWFWWALWLRSERTRRDFVQVSKILLANFWPFHYTAKLPYVKK